MRYKTGRIRLEKEIIPQESYRREDEKTKHSSIRDVRIRYKYLIVTSREQKFLAIYELLSGV